ncbi:hypothetical protein PMAYCL1PPCAC_09943, partial [Pristionchus mayeri]
SNTYSSLLATEMIRSGSHDSFERIEDSSPASREVLLSDTESVSEDDIQVMSVKIPTQAEVIPGQTISEMLEAMEERLLAVIHSLHEDTTAQIKRLEARLEGVKIDLTKGMDDIIDATKNRSEVTAKMETNDALLNDIARQVGALKELHITQQRMAEEKREHQSKKKRHCEAAKKTAMECYDKIKTHVRTLAKGTSTSASEATSASDAVDVAAEAHADDPELQALKLNRKACRIAFRSDGCKESRRWFVARVTEPEPCVLREGDEIVTIGGEQVSGVSLDRIKELVAASNATVEVRRAEKSEQGVKNVDE